MAVSTKSIPLIFINIAEYFAIMPKFFNVEVNIAIKTMITHWPSANANNKETEKSMLLDTVARAIMLINNGDEQGLDARANTQPTINGRRKSPPFWLFGIFFTSDGKFISINPSKFNPRINITEANSSNIIGEAILVNAFPVNAQKIPIMLSIADNPNENDKSCINNLLFLSFEYPPMYPMIRGSIPKLQGDIEAIIPAINAPISIIGINSSDELLYVDNVSIKLFIT